jgi:hypothetical protein
MAQEAHKTVVQLALMVTVPLAMLVAVPPVMEASGTGDDGESSASLEWR